MREYGTHQHPEAAMDDQGSRGNWLTRARSFFKRGKVGSAQNVAAETQVSEREHEAWMRGIERLTELERALAGSGINLESIFHLFKRRQALSTDNPELFEYAKLFMSVSERIPVVEIILDGNFSDNAALHQLDSVIAAPADEDIRQSSRVRFFDRIKDGKAALAIFVGKDANVNDPNVRDFSNSVRAYGQHQRGFVVVAADSEDDFNRRPLNEMAINGMFVGKKKAG